MIKINIIAVGKIKEKYIINGISEFKKRLTTLAKTNVFEIKEEKNESVIDITLKKEEERIINVLNKLNGYNILLDLEGKSLSSIESSNLLDRLIVNGKNPINFIIGSSHGVSEKIKKISDYRLCFSKMTFPHQLMRLILFEQIYRWVNILENGKYHK